MWNLKVETLVLFCGNVRTWAWEAVSRELTPRRWGGAGIYTSLQQGPGESESRSVLCPTLSNSMDYTVHGILQGRTLGWVAYPFSSRSSWPRNQTGVSCIAGGFFTNWAISSVQFSGSVMSDSLWPHGLQHARLPCSSPTPKACSNSCPLSWWCHPNISSVLAPFQSPKWQVIWILKDYC